MYISGAGNESAQASMLQMKQKIDSFMQTAVSKANADNGNPFGDSVEFSGPSELLSKLSQLKSEDPEKFKAVMQDISDNLKAQAANTGSDTKGAQFLTDMSEKFANAADSGDLSVLQPPKPPEGGGGNAGKISQYLSQLGSDDKQSLLDALLSMLESDDDDSTDTTSSSTDSDSSQSVTLAQMKNMLKTMLQSLLENKQE